MSSHRMKDGCVVWFVGWILMFHFVFCTWNCLVLLVLNVASWSWKPSEFRSDFIEELLGTPGQRQDVSVEMEVENQHTSVKRSQQVYLGRTRWFRVSSGFWVNVVSQGLDTRALRCICLQPKAEQEGISVSGTAVTVFGLKSSAPMNSYTPIPQTIDSLPIPSMPP